MWWCAGKSVDLSAACAPLVAGVVGGRRRSGVAVGGHGLAGGGGGRSRPPCPDARRGHSDGRLRGETRSGFLYPRLLCPFTMRHRVRAAGWMLYLPWSLARGMTGASCRSGAQAVVLAGGRVGAAGAGVVGGVDRGHLGFLHGRRSGRGGGVGHGLAPCALARSVECGAVKIGRVHSVVRSINSIFQEPLL